MPLFYNLPIGGYTTILIGGKSSCFFAPKSVREFIEYLPKLVQDYDIYTLGGGSNTIFGNFKGCVLYTGHLRRFRFLKETERWVEIEIFGGTPLRELIKTCLSNNWSGLEGLFGIPKITLGGAVAMNTSAYGFEVGKLVKEVKFLSFETLNVEVDKSPNFGYRSSPYPAKGIVISATLRLVKSKKPVRETVRKLNMERRKKQPLDLPTAGSTFKNPKGEFAGKLLEEVGLKGYCTENGLCFSKKHANFLVNLEKRATLSDVLKLLELAKERVYKTFDLLLEEEVKIVGN